MSSIVPFQFQSLTVRTVVIDDEVWFVGKDVAVALGYANTREAVADNCKRAKSLKDIGVASSYPFADQALSLDLQTKLIPESDVYRLVMRSKLESAERFQDWVVEEVLPSIRKTGSYSVSAVKPSAKRKTSALSLAKVYLLFSKEMEKIGVDKGLALSYAMNGIQVQTGINMEPLRLGLPAPEKICNLNQGQLGTMVGLSPVAIGKLLRKHGLMEDDAAGDRQVTEKGKQYGTMVPFTNNGHSGYEPRWNDTVLDAIAEDLPKRPKLSLVPESSTTTQV